MWRSNVCTWAVRRERTRIASEWDAANTTVRREMLDSYAEAAGCDPAGPLLVAASRNSYVRAGHTGRIMLVDKEVRERVLRLEKRLQHALRSCDQLLVGALEKDLSAENAADGYELGFQLALGTLDGQLSFAGHGPFSAQQPYALSSIGAPSVTHSNRGLTRRYHFCWSCCPRLEAHSLRALFHVEHPPPERWEPPQLDRKALGFKPSGTALSWKSAVSKRSRLEKKSAVLKRSCLWKGFND